MFHEQPMISKWIAEMYEQEETETDDVDFLLSILGKKPKKILEVCCGSGRILVPLAKAGHTADGMDADESMLAKIPDKTRGLRNITWRKGDAVCDSWGSGYNVVILAGNILFNIISDIDYEDAQELFIQKSAAALSPGGYLYIDYQPGGHSFLHPEKVPEIARERVVWEGFDNEGNWGRMALINEHYDPKTHVDSFTRRFELILRNGDRICEDIPSVKHFATLEQLHGWLGQYGFLVEQEYGDYARHPISENTHRAILYARKP